MHESIDSALYVDGGYLAENPTWHAEDGPIKACWIAAMIERHLPAISAARPGPLSIIDVGCGVGAVLAELQKRLPAARLEGIEVSPHALAACSARANAGLTFRLGSLADCPADAAHIVMAIDVIEHVPDYLGFIDALRDKGDFKLLHIPLDLTAYSVARPKIIAAVRAQFGHLHYFTKDSAIAALEATGYAIIDWRYTHHARELPGGGVRRALWNAVRRVIGWVDEDLAVRLLGGASLLVLAR